MQISYEMIIGGLFMLAMWLMRELYRWLRTREVSGGDLHKIVDAKVDISQRRIYESIAELNTKITELIQRFDQFFVEVKVGAVSWSASVDKVRDLDERQSRLERSFGEFLAENRSKKNDNLG